MYFITTFQVHKDVLIDKRCVGYYESYEQSARVVRENVGDIYEGIYNYAVIEGIPSGLYQHDPNPHWFQITDKNTYVEIEKPEFAKHADILVIG